MLIDWLPQALKRFYSQAGKSSESLAMRKRQRERRLCITQNVECLENRELLSAVTSLPSSLVNVDPVLMSLAGLNNSSDIQVNSALYSSTNTQSPPPGAGTATGFAVPTTNPNDSLVQRDSSGRVGVRITATDPTALVPALQSLGLAVSGVAQAQHFLEGFIAVNQIPNLS
ncbi:MAG: hypothetical protein JWM11_4281 [Planctomycetaceae bacterium]|nr:hypothetical protein [Planctomycetaceae bacterium]